MRMNFEMGAVAMMAGYVLASNLGEGIMDFHVFPRAVSNYQSFTGALGGAAADPITATGNAQHPFEVDGSTFPDFESALDRSCSNQHNACAALANAAQDKGGITVPDCDTQQTQCLAAPQASNGSAVTTSAIQASANVVGSQALGTTTLLAVSPTLFSTDAEFFYFCEPTAA